MTRMMIRKLRIGDLINVQNLIKGQLKSNRKRQVSRFFHFIFNLPFRSLGLDSFIGSVAQTSDGKIIGVIVARRFPFAKIWVIGPVVVSRHYRSLGIGTRIMGLLLKLLKDKKAKWAILIIDNARGHSAARSFMKKFGFKYLNCIFVSRGQARNYARVMTLKEFLHSRTEEGFSQEIDSRRSLRTWYIILKKL